MKKQQIADEIGKLLDKYHPQPPIPLKHSSLFTLLISVLLSAQCTDERVNKTTPALFELAETPEKMTELSISKIEEIIRPCGLAPQKSKAIAGLSRILIEKHQGQVPRSLELLEELPGVGHKTASVVMVQGFGEPAFPVDTHIHRLAYRWKLSSGKNVETTERDLKKLIPESLWGLRHLQFIYFGRSHCPARGHVATNCPICAVYGRKDMKT